MIDYAISTAIASKLFNCVIVSTDDEEIANISRQSGALVPFMRSSELADDYTSTVAVISDAIFRCEELGWNIEQVCCIYPCVPFLRIEDLTKGLSLLETASHGYCFSVSEFPTVIGKALQRLEDGRMSPIFDGNELARTQDFKKVYRDAGQFYWGYRSAWLNNKFIHQGGIGVVIPRYRAIDIDTLDDWFLAEQMQKAFSGLWKDGDTC